MEQYYTNQFLTAYNTEDGIYIEEKQKGSFKMLFVLLGLSLLIVVGGFLIGMFGGNIGRIMAPFLIWGGAIVLTVCILVFILKVIIKFDPKITFDKNKKELGVRGKVFPFDSIEKIEPNLQAMFGKTMCVAFIHTGGKKKSLFSTSIVVPEPRDMEDLINGLNDFVQKSKTGNTTED